MKWIHDEACFSEDRIKERAKKHGFSDPVQVEYFLWDCEIAAQLQSESSDFILKGGAAVQLYLPVEMQRGSIDIDIVCPFTEQEIVKVLSHIHERLQTVDFARYTPKNPKKKIDMVTYIAKTPAIVSSEKEKPREIKIDFLLEDLNLPTETVGGVETFAVDVKKLRCYSISALLGDKLLTLAENTIGITEPADIPKQVYDVSLLSEKHKPTQKHFSETIDVIGQLTPIEAGYRDLKLTSTDALKDVGKTMEKYGLLDTPGADAGIKRNITIFQQIYVNISQKRPWYEWCARALRIRFLSQLIEATIEKQTTAEKALNAYNSAIQTAEVLKTISGEEVKSLNKKLLDSADTEIPYPKNLRGKPLNRVFWQVVSPENLNSIKDYVETKVS